MHPKEIYLNDATGIPGAWVCYTPLTDLGNNCSCCEHLQLTLPDELKVKYSLLTQGLSRVIKVCTAVQCRLQTGVT